MPKLRSMQDAVALKGASYEMVSEQATKQHYLHLFCFKSSDEREKRRQQQRCSPVTRMTAATAANGGRE